MVLLILVEDILLCLKYINKINYTSTQSDIIIYNIYCYIIIGY